MENVTGRIDKVNSFLKMFDKAWKGADLEPLQRSSLTSRLDSIASSMAQRQRVWGNIFDFDGIGVVDVSDLITYLFVSRFAYNLDDFVDDKPALEEVYGTWFNLVNYLLLTNIFEPNDDVDQKDLGTGKYSEVHSVTRKAIAKHVFTNFDDLMAIDVFDALLNHGRLLKPQLKSLASQLDQNPDLLREQLENQIRAAIGPSTSVQLRNWILHDLTDDNWESLTSKYLSLVTPPFLLKNVGLARELFVFAVLTASDIGYVIPLLLHQKLFSRYHRALEGVPPQIRAINILDPPDFMLVKRGRILGVELGRGKPELISNFAAASGLPTAFVTPRVGNAKMGKNGYYRDLGYKCNLCHLSFGLCNRYIELFNSGQIKDDLSHELPCVQNCSQEICSTCPDSAVLTEFQHGQKTVKAVVHRNCLAQVHPDKAKDISANQLFPLFPSVEGLDQLKVGF